MDLFFLKLLLTNGLFSIIIGLFILKLNKGRYHAGELLLYSLGLGPAMTVLILYYLLLLIPHRSGSFYLAIIILTYVTMLAFSIKGIQQLVSAFKKFFNHNRGQLQGLNFPQKFRKSWYWLLLSALFGTFLLVYFNNTLKTPIEGHDTLIYGNIGKIYYGKKAITYSNHIFDKNSGFYFSGSPKPSFSLLLTWEMIINSCFGMEENPGTPHNFAFDLYFRSISAYFALLILGVSFLWLFRKNRYLALLGILVLLASFRFFLLFINYHLDSFRIFFLLLSWVFLAYTLKNRDIFSFLLLGIFSGFTAFTHLIGAAVALLNCLVFFIFFKKSLSHKVLRTVVLTLLILAFGGIHYVLEASSGAISGFLTYF